MPNGRHPEHDRLMERAAEKRANMSEKYSSRLEYLLVEATVELVMNKIELPKSVREWWQSTGKYKYLGH